MAYRTSPYSDLDWLTAALMGEAGPKDTPSGMGALADVIMNRVNGTQAPNTAYGNRYTYDPGTVAGQISAYQGESPQFSSYDRDQSAREGNGSSAANRSLMDALTKGASAFSGSSLDKYNQARAVASSFLDQADPNYGRFSGSSGGSDFFVAKDFPTYLRNSGRYQSQTIGGSDFFKLASNGQFTPWNDPGDRGTSSLLPQAGSDGFGADTNVSGGVGNGSFGNAGGTFETGSPYGFSQGDFSGGVGDGSLGAGIIPNQDITRFGQGFDPSGGLDPMGGLGSFQGTFDPAAYLQANPDVAAAGVDPLQHWLRYGQAEGRPLTADFSGGTMDLPSVQGGPNVSAGIGLGGFNLDGFGFQQPQMAGLDGLSPLGSVDTPAPITADFSGSPLSPVDPGNPIATPAPITADFGSPLAAVPTGPSVSQGVAPGTFQGTFNGADYLAANQDLAGFNVDPLQHYLSYGYQEGRALDTAGDRINQGFDPSAYMQANPDAAASGVSALQHYIQYGAHEGRAANFSGGVAPGSFGAGIVPAPSIQSPMDYGAFGSIDTPAPIAGGNFGADLSPVSTGPNVSAGVGNGTFRGTFNGADYLAANPDVAAAHVDPLQHYLTSGYNEGRALDVQGDRINQGFNPSQYFTANPDAAASGVSALQHYIQYGAHEGRAADFSGGVSPGNFGAGITPYAPAPGPMDFSGSNVGQGLGPTGNGAFGLPQSAPSIPDFGAGYNVSGGVQNGGFGLGGVMSGNYGGGGFNPYGFSGANVGGGLGAQPQSMGSLYPAGNGQGGGLDPYGFSQANVGGFDANSFGGGGGGGGVEDFAAGTKDFNLSPGFEPTASEDFSSGQGDYSGEYGGGGFNPQASEMAYLRGELANQYAANAKLADSANAGINFANQGAAQANQLNAVGAANAARQFAGIQGGLGIAPVPGTSFAPAPVGIQTIGGIGPSNFGMAGLGGAPLRGFF